MRLHFHAPSAHNLRHIGWYVPRNITLLNVLVMMRSSGFGVSPICTISEMPTMPCDLCCASDMLWYSSLLKPYSWICVPRVRATLITMDAQRLELSGRSVNHLALKPGAPVAHGCYGAPRRQPARIKSARRNHKRCATRRRNCVRTPARTWLNPAERGGRTWPRNI